MTNFDSPIDIPTSTSSAGPNRPGIWRVASLLAIVAAVLITALAVLQARDASNVPAPDRTILPLETARVTVTDLPIPASAEIAVLGLPHDESRRGFDQTGADLDLPRGRAAVVALRNTATNELVGLAVVRKDSERTTVEISAYSTAEALLVLSPAALRPDLQETFAQVEVVENDASFDLLVQAVAANPTISSNNEPLEQAYAAIAERIKVQTPAPDQGCDSVVSSAAFPAAGACVQPGPGGLTITNEQDRWALIFSGTPGTDFSELCAVASPTRTNGDEVVIPAETCQGRSLMVAPGPVIDQGQDQMVITERVRLAAAVNVLYDYAGPFADLAGGSTGFNLESVTYISSNSEDVVASLARLIDDEEFAAAMDVSLSASTAVDRHIAATSATLILIEAADTTRIIPQRSPGDAGHTDLLGFYARSAERMVGESTTWRWQADAVGIVDFGGQT